jgi:hypothetical protein
MPETPLVRTAGWREWVGLPDLGLGLIKAKLDTGARSSALHAWDVTPMTYEGRDWVEFSVHPLHRDDRAVVRCRAPLVDRRTVKSSTGTRTRRFVIKTRLQVGDALWPIEVTLSNRRDMMFRMLLGRTALGGRLLVDSKASYLLSPKHPNSELKT